MSDEIQKDSAEQTEALRLAVQVFVRGFGLLEPNQTPCGQRLPVSEAYTLMELLRSDGVSQGDMAAKLALSKSTLSRIVARMAAKGRLIRRRDVTDRRVMRLFLTQSGRRLAKQVDQRSFMRFSGIVDDLPGGSLAQVIDGLQLLTRAIAQGRKPGEV